ncbi:MAG: hypothetical protein LBG80_03330 [Bacteroidales bacterium]|jgi:Zn-dependent membrane protease YugP|nr:hypothetical protein [Bacteroidales bacterium]
MNRFKKFIEDGIAVMMIVGFAIRKFKKVIIGGVTMGVIVVFAIVNVNIENSTSNLGNSLYLCNIDALADESGESGGTRHLNFLN